MAQREDRIFAWEIDGDGTPKYEFVSDDSKKSFDFIDSTANGKYSAVGGNGKFSIYETDGAESPLSEIDPPERLYGEAKFVEDGKYYVSRLIRKKIN